jgi:hypothetical protein
MRLTPVLITCVLGASAMTSAAADWQPANSPLMTRWAADVSPDNVLPEYPRPQLQRAQWLNLNGLWDYAITDPRGTPPDEWDGAILVPFAVESALSGVKRPLEPTQELWYRRTFEVPADWDEEHRIRLNFGAVDWQARVWINDTLIGEHRGGYDPFSFDITDAIDRSGANTLVVAVTDPTDAGPQARGKQVLAPHGIFYTAVSGIWQTVWLEPVPLVYFEQLDFETTVNPPRLTVRYTLSGPTTDRDRGRLDWVEITVKHPESNQVLATGSGTGLVRIDVPDARPWSPDDPQLYDVTATLNVRRYRDIDPVTSYVGFREIAVRPDADGRQQLFLNHQPVFSYGPLDQGYWPDGLYTAPTDAALRSDIELTKRLGFNSIRKHVKVEPARWYYWTDQLGLLVWQDLPSAWEAAKLNDDTVQRSDADRAQFERELARVVTALRNHPSLVIWVPFNEGWGQYDTERIAWQVHRLHPASVINSVSGWYDKQVGDVVDWHTYPDPIAPTPEALRAGVIGEFGGLNLEIPNHLWRTEGNFGYRGYADRAALNDAYLAMLTTLRALRATHGLSGAIYTQTTDVEIEINGLVTYDRAVVKLDEERVAAATAQLYGPLPAINTLLPIASEAEIAWRYTTTKPADGWTERDFDDSAWSEGPAGFGTAGTPNLNVRTTWDGSDIWLRRPVRVRRPVKQPLLAVYHDENCEIFINGQQVAQLTGHTTHYKLIPVDPAVFRAGGNLLAVHCRQTAGGQGIDVGLIDLR